MFSFLRSRRRRRLIREPFPHEWRRVLLARVRHFAYLDSERRDRLEAFVRVLVAEKDWAGGSGFSVTDEMKVTIAGYAGVMTLGLVEPYYFDRLKTIVVYPGAYQPHASRFDQRPSYDPHPRLGESWHRGPMVLSWAAIANTGYQHPGSNLVFHEFAHHVDGLDGDMDGTPAVGGRAKRRTWNQVVDEEFARLRSEAMHGQATLLDVYGSSSRPEFFAVATECFFERPSAMRTRHRELYRLLADFYGQDVAAWLPDAVGADAREG